MTVAPDKPTRIAADLVESAATEGKKASRSGKQQLDFWIRMGRSMDMRSTASQQRIAAAVAGSVDATELTEFERSVLNAEIDAEIQQRARAISFGEQLAAAGITTVSLDDDGNLITTLPDGTTSIMDSQPEAK
ncbi:MAG: hypothetical protein WC054_08940 [Candidatus Nanopelagicales bacterium]